MNELIKKLAEQSYEQQPLMIANPQTFEIEHKIGNGGVPMYHRVFNQEKFAESIVKECIHTLQLKIVRNGNTPENKRSREHIRDLAEHFGVQL